MLIAAVFTMIAAACSLADSINTPIVPILPNQVRSDLPAETEETLELAPLSASIPRYVQVTLEEAGAIDEFIPTEGGPLQTTLGDVPRFSRAQISGLRTDLEYSTLVLSS